MSKEKNNQQKVSVTEKNILYHYPHVWLDAYDFFLLFLPSFEHTERINQLIDE